MNVRLFAGKGEEGEEEMGEEEGGEEEGERRPRPKKARKDNDNIAALGDYGMLFLRELFS